MKYIKYTFWGIVAVCLIIVGLANRGDVTVRAMPEALATPLGLSPDVQIPLFVVMFLGVGVGLLVGFLWEWIREHRIRSDARAKDREVARLKGELDRLQTEKHEGKDEIVALLDKTG